MHKTSVALAVVFLSSLCLAQVAERPLRVAIVGLVHDHVHGFFENNQHRPDLQIVGIAEPNRELAEKYAREFKLDVGLIYADLEQMIGKTRPDAALTYTNTFDHRRVVEICAKHGIPVMMEKPLAVSLADARAIANAASRGKISILVNYETTWYRSNQAAYRLAHDGSIGEIRKIVVHDGHSGPKEIGVSAEFVAWLTDPKLNGAGALFDFGCYGADLATWLIGTPPDSVSAVTQHFKPEMYARVEDEATVILTYPKAQAILQASWNWPYNRKDMEVYGTGGYAITERSDNLRFWRTGTNEQQLSPAPLAAPYDDAISELRAVVFQHAPPDGLSSLETNLIVMEILDAAQRSAAEGRTVRLSGPP